MKAITICQPYAHLIVATKTKRVENRTWETRYRGQLLIHAGKSRDWLDGYTDDDLLKYYGEPLAFGAIVGQVMLIDCLHYDNIKNGKHDTTYPWLREHEHTNGPWCWVLANPIRFDVPLPWRGAQGLFEIDLPPAMQLSEAQTNQQERLL